MACSLSQVVAAIAAIVAIAWSIEIVVVMAGVRAGADVPNLPRDSHS